MIKIYYNRAFRSKNNFFFIW